MLPSNMPDITHIGQLHPDPHNARKHNPRNVQTIVNALHEVGAARSIVIDEHDVVLAGNGVVEGAAQAGIERVRVIDADGEEIIAVRRRGLTDEQKTRLALYDNRASELAEWDVDVIAELAEDNALDGLFNENEIDRILGNLQDVDASELWKGMPEFAQEDALGWKVIAVHFENEQDYEEFSRLINQTLTKQTKYIWYPARARNDLQALRFADEP